MLDFLQYGYMQRALIGGLLIAVICPVVGVFLVLRRLALIGDGMAHTAFGGVAFGLFLNTLRLPFKIYPLLTALLFCLASAFGIQQLKKARVYGDVAIAIFFSFGLALGVIFVSFSKGFTSDLYSLLFGNILVISQTDILLIVILSVCVLGAIAGFYKELFYITFDEESAQASGLPVERLNTLLIVLIALTVVMSMSIMGMLLVTSLLVIPAATALQLGRSFRNTIIIAVALGVFSVTIGLGGAYALNLPAAGAIVMILVIVFFGSILFKKRLNG